MRHKVGMVFQYPEHQLFEETIAEDIAFGPKNLGLSADEVDERVRDAMKFVGLDYEYLRRAISISSIWWANAPCCHCWCSGYGSRFLSS